MDAKSRPPHNNASECKSAVFKPCSNDDDFNFSAFFKWCSGIGKISLSVDSTINGKMFRSDTRTIDESTGTKKARSGLRLAVRNDQVTIARIANEKTGTATVYKVSEFRE